jgi:thioredoxin-like negative regulator of GroEL
MNLPGRREKIEAMLAQDPQDQFLRYTLAMECEKAGEYERSLELFQGLMSDDKPHVPSFLMAGQSLNNQGRIEEARAVLRTGIEIARGQGNGHAAAEMSELLASL